MKGFSSLPFLRVLFPTKDQGAEAALRWKRAFRQEPLLAEDIAGLGRVFETLPVQFDDQGVEQPVPIDPVRMAYDQGRRDLALSLLAMGHIRQRELNALMESSHDYD